MECLSSRIVWLPCAVPGLMYSVQCTPLQLHQRVYGLHLSDPSTVAAVLIFNDRPQTKFDESDVFAEFVGKA